MGVPKFYRWISERYPCLSEVVKEYQIPEFDNLYLDMNGLIHPCAHPDDSNPHFRITEEKIFQDIFHYIEVLFRMIRPRKVFFMAVDGVAPRAKMNQQRGRRFRSAREAEDLVRKALEKGEILPKEERFDSNCITPGTEFMTRLQEQLKYFVIKKISTDKAWQGIRVYLSGHQTPGEGEHKVMDFIRAEKSSPDYDPNTRHCLYGLDADLIMLGLTTHEPHFSLLREEIVYGKKSAQQKRSTAPEETTFHLLHLSLMREYLEFEFSSLKGKLEFPFDIEHIIDDWVLMGFLVGNDFIPHLPHMHIHQDALPTLWKVYMQVLPTLDGYLHEHGFLNLPRFEKYLTALSEEVDINRFSDTYDDLKWLAGRTGRKIGEKPKLQQNNGINSAITLSNEFTGLEDFNGEPEDLPNDFESTPLDNSPDEEYEEDSEDSEYEDNLFDAEFKMHKANYYMEKLAYEQVTPDVLQEQARGYVKAIQWILLYYYTGCPSWSWYYEHHYAPYMSDVRGFSDMKMEFDMGKPFLPFQQLMAVLPAASKNLLPKPFQSLMVMDNSPVIDFYPVNFETDLNGKLQEWEAVVLIPFIDEKRLLKAMDPLVDNLTAEEKARNSYGPCLLNEHTEEQLQSYPSSMPGLVPDVLVNHCSVTEIAIDAFVLPPEKQFNGLCAGVRLDIYFPGFPTLKHIPHKAELKKEQVKVFQQNSRGENMMLHIMDEREPEIEQLARDVLGKPVYVAWPHLFEARVVMVSDDQLRFSVIDKEKQKGRPAGSNKFDISREELTEREAALWHRTVESLAESYHDRKGIEVGATFAILHALPMRGRKYVCGTHGNVTLEKQWACEPVPYLYQTTLKDIGVKDPSFTQYKTLEDLFPIKSPVFMLANPSYAHMGEVLSVDVKNGGRIRINVPSVGEPNLEHLRHHQGVSSCEGPECDCENFSVKYMPGYIMAQRLGVNNHLLSRITGTVFVTRGSKENPGKDKVNVGLNLKFNKKNEEVPGYTRKTDEGWLYSQKASQTLEDYIHKFPDLFDFMGMHKDENMYFESDIFEDESGRLQEVSKYLKELPCRSVQPMKIGSHVLDDLMVEEIEKIINMNKEENLKKSKNVKMQVRPHLLFRPLDLQGNLVPDPTTTYELLDRVINVREGFSVPLGLRGTVIGILSAEKETDVLYEVVFDEEFLGGLTIRCSPNRAYRMPPNALLNLLHGERKERAKHKPTAVVKPQEQHNAKNWSSKMANGKQAWYSQDRFAYQNQDKANSHRSNSFRDHSRANEQMSSADEFENMWQSLHSANLLPKKESSSSRETFNPAMSTSKAPSLQQAASALNSSDLKTRGHPDQNNTGRYTGENRQTFDDRSKDRNKDGSINKKSHYEQNKPPRFSVKNDTPRFSVKNEESSSSQSAKTTGSFSASCRSHKDNHQNRKFAQATNDEFSSLLKSLEISENKQKESATGRNVNRNQDSNKMSSKSQVTVPCSSENQKEKELQNGTDALREMLKIGAGASASHPQSSSSVSTTLSTTATEPAKSTSTPQYGKQLSVQELFQGAQCTPTGPPQPQPSQQERLPPQRPNPHRSQVADLQMWCRSVGLGGPRYDYSQTSRGCIAYVTLSNGLRFQGSAARDRDMAAESAASMAMLTMQSRNMPPMNFMLPNMQGSNRRPLLGPGGIMSSPNSAFTPVGSCGVPGMPFGPPGGIGFPNPRFGPVPRYNMQPQVQPGLRQPPRDSRPHTLPVRSNYNTAQTQQHVGGIQQGPTTGQKAPSGESHSNQSAPASAPPIKTNPFVPLQVQKQQVTPQKPGKRESEDEPSTESKPAEARQAQNAMSKESLMNIHADGASQPSANPNTAPSTASENVSLNSVDVNGKVKSTQQSTTGNYDNPAAQSQTQKKSRSRLAIKFSTPPS